MAQRSLPARTLGVVGAIVIGIYTGIDFVTAPVLRPLGELIARSSPMNLVRRLSRRLPAYAALVCLILPLAVAEPAKIFALYLIGDGHYISGVATLVGAYLTSLLLVDTIYEGARPQLRSIGWFAIVVDHIAGLRQAIVARLRDSRAYRLMRTVTQRVRAWLGRRRAGLVR